jgi:hypothetical protein
MLQPATWPVLAHITAMSTAVIFIDTGTAKSEAGGRQPAVYMTIDMDCDGATPVLACGPARRPTSRPRSG